jgi:hypothetical protein
MDKMMVDMKVVMMALQMAGMMVVRLDLLVVMMVDKMVD